MQAVMDHGHSNGIHQKTDIQYQRNHRRQGPSHSNLTTRHQISSWRAERPVEPKPIHAITNAVVTVASMTFGAYTNDMTTNSHVGIRIGVPTPIVIDC